MLDTVEYREEERRAQYPDAIRFRLPRGFRERLKRAAQAESVPASELIRRAIALYLNANNGGRSNFSASGAGA